MKHLVNASEGDRRVPAADETGALVWLAAVKEVGASGQLVLTYDRGGKVSWSSRMWRHVCACLGIRSS